MTIHRHTRPSFLALLGVALLACSGTGPSQPPGNGNGNGTPAPPPPPSPPPADATITIDPSTVHQTMQGWEGTMEMGEVHDPEILESYQDELFDLVVNELGLNRIRLEVRSGAQNPIDWFDRWQKRQIPHEEWRRRRYEISDQAVYHFTEIDFWIEHSVEPMRRELAANGEELYVNLCYVNFETQVPNQIHHHWDDPDAYGAFMVALFQHIENRWGWVPDAVEIVLEPDNIPGWTGTRIGEAMVAAGNALNAAGYSPAFIAPSNTSMGAAIEYFDDLIAVPGAAQYIDEFSYHRYRDVSEGNLVDIANRGRQFGIRTAMLEHIGSGYEDLHEDIMLGGNSAWQQYVIAFPELTDRGGNYFMIDLSPIGPPRIVPGFRNRFLKLYFRYVRRNAVRIGATSEDARFDPLAFRNTDGSHVMVIKASSGGDFTIGGLPAGSYGIRYSTEDEDDRDAGTRNLQAGQTLSAAIPDEGVLTVFAQ